MFFVNDDNDDDDPNDNIRIAYAWNDYGSFTYDVVDERKHQDGKMTMTILMVKSMKY